MALVTASIFKKILSAWRIRESVALTKIDLGRAIPVLPLETSIQAEVATHLQFMLLNVFVAAGRIDADPRTPSDWNRIIVNGQSTDPSASFLGAIPTDHDYVILGAGGKSDASAVSATLAKRTSGNPDPEVALFHWTGSEDEVLHNANGPAAQVLQAGMWVAAGDPGFLVLVVSDASTVDFQVDILHAPQGILRPV